MSTLPARDAIATAAAGHDDADGDDDADAGGDAAMEISMVRLLRALSA